MSSTCFDTEGSSSGRRLYIYMYDIICLYSNGISCLLGGIVSMYAYEYAIYVYMCMYVRTYVHILPLVHTPC
jgi:hypothetical protein